MTFTKKPKKKAGTRRGKRPIRIGFKSSEGASTFECSINGAEFKPCTRPLKKKFKSKPGKGAKYKVSVRATDQAGNTGAASSIRFRVVRRG